VSPSPSPATDKTAARKPIDAAGTSAFPFGDPREVGLGERKPVPRTTGKATTTKAAGAKKGAAAAAEPEADAEESDEAENE
jgi:hypothetical protein